MSIFTSPNYLRNVLLADAATCFGSGALQVFATDLLVRLLSLPSALLMGSGVFLLVYAAVVAFIATRQPLPRIIVWLLVAGNAGWAVLCVALLQSGQITPSTLGSVYVAIQAVTVVVLAELQWLGLRRGTASPLAVS